MGPFKLFLDDDALTPGLDSFRYPPGKGWYIATSSEVAIEMVKVYGFPDELSLDHDLGKDHLGKDDDVMTFLKWLYEKYPNSTPVWTVHSKNVEGAKNIDAFLNSWIKSKEL
jgi:hypothetical protein